MVIESEVRRVRGVIGFKPPARSQHIVEAEVGIMVRILQGHGHVLDQHDVEPGKAVGAVVKLMLAA